jgi:3-hydroxyisobutyrate dehydrogenase-like beta-hydroxyacid dehydrogenase
MCKNLIEKGSLQAPLILYNRTQKRSEDLAASHPSSTTKVASTIAEAVGPSDIIFTCLGDDAAVQDTITSALQSSNVTGKLFVDCSTIHPDTTNALSEQITGAGAHFVAMPVFGAPAAADAGQLVCLLAGPKEQTERVKPFTTGVMGRAVIDLSEQEPGKATLLKVIGNTFILNMVETLSEGLVLSEKTGLGVDNLHTFIETMFPGPYAAYSTRMRSGEYHKREEPLFAVDLARKDARHAMKLAQDAGCRMKDVEVADQHLKEVKEHMGTRGDIAGIYGAVRKEGGLKFENN